MSSFITIEIDTMQPEIEIYAPSYTTSELLNEITIKANEELNDYQEIYIIDSNGSRYDYTFQKNSKDEYIGLVKFINFPLGIATIYARMMDSVGNISSIVNKSIVIKEALTLLTLKINDRQASIDINDRQMDIEIADRSVIDGY